MTTKKRHAHELSFFIEDKDNGHNTIDMTQRRINNTIFGVNESNIFSCILRNVVWSQMFSQGFLTYGDRDSKRELGRLVNIELWELLQKTAKGITY